MSLRSQFRRKPIPKNPILISSAAAMEEATQEIVAMEMVCLLITILGLQKRFLFKRIYFFYCSCCVGMKLGIFDLLVFRFRPVPFVQHRRTSVRDQNLQIHKLCFLFQI
jgi:hypothetical protein